MARALVVLGATGSIGSQTLDVARRLGLSVRSLAARRASDQFLAIAEAWPDAAIVIEGAGEDERAAFEQRLGRPVRRGSDAVVEAAGIPGSIVVNGIVGAAGLASSVAALNAGNRLALANKESLVAGGPVVLAAAERGGGELIPVDSEHSALYQCLVGEEPEHIERLLLTASGGPFFGWAATDLADVTPEQALAHPTWDMGSRVTVDSATLMNKGLEVIEAHYLFGVPYDQIDVVIHRQSIVHSIVEFVDGSMKAQLGEPDMRLPIQYAITYPDRAPARRLSGSLIGATLEFAAPDRTAFPALDLAYEAGRRGGSAPAALNAADEVAVGAFLDGRIPFTGIFDVVSRVLDGVPHRDPTGVDEVLTIDREARELAYSMLPGSC